MLARNGKDAISALIPAGLRSLSCNFLSALGCQFGCSCFAAPFRDLGCGTGLLFKLAIFHLTGCDIDDELSELDRVSRAFEAFRTHAENMARLLALANPASSGAR